MSNDVLLITPNPQKGDDGYKVFSIRIKDDTATRIERIAGETNRSRNELIGMLLEYALGHCVVAE